MTRPNSAVLAAVAIVTMASFPSPTFANEYPWCAQYAGGPSGSGRNCGFATLAQCMQTVHGMGGFCEPNLFYMTPSGHPTKRLRRQSRYG
jgi:hypothetical protein